jgi:hypothetical protein
MAKEINYTELYKQTVGEVKDEIVSVTAPSGFIFQFHKPSKHFITFRIGRLPQNATQKAIRGWQEAAGEAATSGGPAMPSDAELTAMFEIRDYVLDRSYKPKLVVGEALNPGELSTDHVSGEDLDFLLRWVAAGGESDTASTFPSGQGSGALASASRKGQRNKGKRTSRA